jgi:1-acyl-sn-glycerol-3-phosphate acyltransferase
VIGAEHVPLEGGVVVVGTHSLASYELFIICHFSEEAIGRKTYIVGDDLMFKIPGLGATLSEIGFIPGNREDAMRRLAQGALIGIAPGGMHESLRPSTERYRYDWSRRRGFAAIAMKAGVPIVPTVCPSADEIFTVHDNPVTRWAYQQMKIPMPLFHGRWGIPVPRPIELIHWIGKPIHPDVPPDRVTDADVDRFHARIMSSIEDLVRQALEAGTNVDHLKPMPLGWR